VATGASLSPHLSWKTFLDGNKTRKVLSIYWAWQLIYHLNESIFTILLKSSLKYSKYSKICKYYFLPNFKILSLSLHVAIGDMVGQCLPTECFTDLGICLKSNSPKQVKLVQICETLSVFPYVEYISKVKRNNLSFFKPANFASGNQWIVLLHLLVYNIILNSLYQTLLMLFIHGLQWQSTFPK